MLQSQGTQTTLLSSKAPSQSILYHRPINMASHIYKLAVHKLKDVETMANYFENTPKYTVWTPKMILRTAFWGFAFPYGLYKLFQPLYVRIRFWTDSLPSSLIETRNAQFFVTKVHIALTHLQTSSFSSSLELSRSSNCQDSSRLFYWCRSLHGIRYGWRQTFAQQAHLPVSIICL